MVDVGDEHQQNNITDGGGGNDRETLFLKWRFLKPPVPQGCSLLVTTGGYIFLKLVVWSSLVPISTNHWGLRPRKKHISPNKNWD